MVRETVTKKVTFGSFNRALRRPQHSVFEKHRIARIKINAKRDKIVLDLSKLTLFDSRDQTVSNPIQVPIMLYVYVFSFPVLWYKNCST